MPDVICLGAAMMLTKRSLLAALAGATMLTAPALTAAWAGDFSSLYIFGDSLMDPGNLGTAAKNAFGAPVVFASPYYKLRPSNGLTLGEYLPGLLGVTSSNVHNYAIAGAESGKDLKTDALWKQVNSSGVEIGVLGTNQVGKLVADGTRIEADALSIIYVGSNDYANAVGGYLNTTSRDSWDFNYVSELTKTTFTSTISNISTAIQKLNSLGEKVFMVMNLPNIWGGDATVLKAFADGRTTFNDALPGEMKKLANQLGVRIIVADVSGFYDAVSTDPSKYGLADALNRCLFFTDVTKIGVNGSSAVTGKCGTTRDSDGTIKADSFFRWDNTHLTTAGNKILADYVAKVLNETLHPETNATAANDDTSATDNVTVLTVKDLLIMAETQRFKEAAAYTTSSAPINAAASPQLGRAIAGAMASQLDGRMGDIAGGDGSASFLSMGNSVDGVRYADASSTQMSQNDAMPTLNGNTARKNGVAAFLRAGYGDGDRDATGKRAGFDYRIYTATAGLDFAVSPTSYLGLALGFADASASLSDGVGHSAQQSWSLTAFGVKKIDALRFDVQAGAAYDDYSDMKRSTGLSSTPVATGATNGNTVFLSGRAGYAVNMGTFTVEPFTSLRYTRVSVKSYDETGGGKLSLQMGRQRASSLVGTLGVEASTSLQIGTAKITPRLRLALDRDLHQGIGILNYGFAGSENFQNEGSEPYLTTGHIGGGVNVDLQPGLVARVGYDTTFLGGGKDQYVIGHDSFAF